MYPRSYSCISGSANLGDPRTHRLCARSGRVSNQVLMSEDGGIRPNSSNTLEQPPINLPNHQGVGGEFIHGSGWATTTPGPHLTTQYPLQYNTTASSDATNSGVGSTAPETRVPVPPAAAHFQGASDWCQTPMAAMIAAATTQGRQPGPSSCAALPPVSGNTDMHPGGLQRTQRDRNHIIINRRDGNRCLPKVKYTRQFMGVHQHCHWQARMSPANRSHPL